MSGDIPTDDIESQLDRARVALDDVRWEQKGTGHGSTTPADVDDVERLESALLEALEIIENNK